MEDKHRSKFINRVLKMDSPLPPLEDSMKKVPYVIALDVGTTSIRSHVYNAQGRIKGTDSKKVNLIHPQPGWVEIDPLELINQVEDCIKNSITAAGLSPADITCLGLTVQRNTFITWDRTTGKPFHNFITWQDLRARETVKNWNSSMRMKVLNGGSSVLHLFTRQKRFLSASVLKFMSPQVSMRLLWALENIQEFRELAAVEELRERAAVEEVMFGCIETWLLYNLTKEKVFATDYSCASGTGMFDPFQVEWSTIVCNLLNIPMHILPEVRDTSGHFGTLDPDVFGAAIPVTAVVSDQSGAMFGECCFNVGDVKCTMGTGTFLDLNTGKSPHASVAGLFPLIGWKIKDDLTYLAEGIISDTGSIIEFAKSLGFIDDVSESARLAASVTDSQGVYFVGAFSGLQAPINDDKAATMLIGLKPGITKAHIVRAILESIAYRFKILYETMLTESKIPLNNIRADGGVCNNDFLMQLMADFTDQVIDRAKQPGEMTSLGAAFLAGLAKGIWKSKEELQNLRQTEKVFTNQGTWSKYKNRFVHWERAVSRSREWYCE